MEDQEGSAADCFPLVRYHFPPAKKLARPVNVPRVVPVDLWSKEITRAVMLQLNENVGTSQCPLGFPVLRTSVRNRVRYGPSRDLLLFHDLNALVWRGAFNVCIRVLSRHSD